MRKITPVNEVEQRAKPGVERAIEPELVDLFGAAAQAFAAPLLHVVLAAGQLGRALERDGFGAVSLFFEVELVHGKRRGRGCWRLRATGALNQAIQASFERANLRFDVAAAVGRRMKAFERVVLETHVGSDHARADAQLGRVRAELFEIVAVGRSS